MNIPFDQMPSNARTWVYTANRLLSSSEENLLMERLTPFLAEWSSHGTPLKAAAKIVDQSVLIIAVENGFDAASGCSIDKSVRILKELEQNLGLSLFDRLQILYKENQQAPVEVFPLADFKQKLLVEQSFVNGLVANTQVNTVGDIPFDLWQEVKKSWLARFAPTTLV